MPKKRTANGRQCHCLSDAIELLRQARDRAEEADCPQLAKAIRRALKSADGASRHMSHRMQAETAR
jgi:hypothetical protein